MLKPATKGGLTLLSLTLALGVMGCDRNPNTPISEADLIAFDKSSFNKSRMSGKHELLGILNGHRVLVDYPCNDLCPDETDRIIHFDVDAGPICVAIGGVSWSGFISSGDFSRACIPKVIYHH